MMFKSREYVAVLRMSAGSGFQTCGRAAMEKALKPNTIEWSRYCKYISGRADERILKIGRRLAMIWTKVWRHVFMAHGVYSFVLCVWNVRRSTARSVNVYRRRMYAVCQSHCYLPGSLSSPFHFRQTTCR